MRDKIRILHIGLSSNIGGIETVVYNWLKMIDRETFQFDFVNVEKTPLAFEEEFKSLGSTVYRISARKHNFIKSYLQLNGIISESDYDFVHYHAMSASWPEPILICDNTRSIPILHIHTVIGDRLGSKRKLLHMLGVARLYNHDYLKIACGEDAGKAMFKNEDYYVIENGIDEDTFRFSMTDRNEVRSKYGIDKNEVVIGHIGRASYEKNYPFLLITFANLLKINSNYRLMLVGNVDTNNQITEEIERLGIKNRIIMTGVVKNVNKYLSSMDLFFLPSIYEGINVSLIEAQANGLPCIASDSISKESGVSDLISFFPMNNEKEIASRISRISLNNEMERTRSRINRNYNINNSVKKLEAFYYMHTKYKSKKVNND